MKSLVPRSSAGLFWLTVMLLVVTFLAADHDLFASRQHLARISGDGPMERSNLTSIDDTGSCIGLLGFAALGVVLLLAPARRPIQRPGILLSLLAGGGAVWIVGLPWSESPVLAAHRVLPWAYFILGFLGLARQFTVRDLAKIVVVVTAVFLALGISAEVFLGTFNPQSSSYQFIGTLSPAAQGIQCSLLILAALAVLGHTRHNLPLHLGFIAIGVLFLLLTRSQISCGTFVIAVLMHLLVRSPSGRGGWHWVWASVLAATLIVTVVLEGQSQNGLRAVVDLVGPSGAALCLLIAGVGSWQAWSQFRRTKDEGYRFLIAQMVVGLVNSVANSQYLQPSLCTAICLASLASLAITPAGEAVAVTEAARENSNSASRLALSRLTLTGS